MRRDTDKSRAFIERGRASSAAWANGTRSRARKRRSAAASAAYSGPGGVKWQRQALAENRCEADGMHASSCTGLGSEAHHWWPSSKGGPDHLENLRWVNPNCHARIHSRPNEARDLDLLAPKRYGAPMFNLTKTASVMHRFVIDDEDLMATFVTYDDDTEEIDRVVSIGLDVYQDLGSPETVTITIEAGDTLNVEASG